ncbi:MULTISPECIES: TetR/AcrR family transcriptional regulator [unclassified Mycobacterium]|uniref:TetR/AcrR family transcriptional regulator n=1 Tax=unclassified Mycobacterium TaxID=2642494 RepID=UPI000800ACCE|nr:MULTISPECIES: TetR/AcrR family transcriptional regulator [unclassified Mycobacterium]OBB41764.1 TetR family transcriptional regulator [Mycobacterium sp. 852002-51961_SCH5331710]OBG96840.1 TetR family transcriptional regulator [Mycobacterium sp. E136]
MANHRERMVASAALLIRERGAHPTAIADVLAHSGAPRGSAYHYFPGGRTQLLCEAVDYASAYIASRIENAGSAADALDALVNRFRKQLADTEFRAGCPVVAVAVESGGKADVAPVVDRAAAAFTSWNGLMIDRLIDDGVAPERAETLAMLVLTSIEGAIVVARTARDMRPLELVHNQLRALLEAAAPDER